MLIKIPRGWEIPEREATPESVYHSRRSMLKALGFAGTAALLGDALQAAIGENLYPAKRNTKYTLDRPVTEEWAATSFNNFYEFTLDKQRVKDLVGRFEIDPWTVQVKGQVNKPGRYDLDDLMKKFPIEERLYRMRCVEAWSMAVPWSGFPLSALVELARPLGNARYLRMETFMDAEMAPGQRQSWYPWPYIEGLTMAEATTELAFIATGLYGKPMPRQNGAPIRLAVPWKYGFKSVKSIVRFTFTDQRPVTFWEAIQPSEYGFWANVNPEVPHPRWSQATERVLGSDERVPTQLFNGYGEYVAHLYRGLDGERLFA
jgi:sulfoxide reductase catalytic subunit YedY